VKNSIFFANNSFNWEKFVSKLFIKKV
jgi:hypothetical protein